MKMKYTIIGAGVVGLAVARSLARVMPSEANLLVVEKEDTFGRGTSSRNSEVIHSGIYYPHGSLKHRLCIAGRRLLYDYCRERGVNCLKCGKLIVATDEAQLPDIERLFAQSQKNGVENVSMIDREKALSLEPDINVVRALFSAETGIIDAHGLMRALASEVTDLNAMIVYRSAVRSIAREGDGYAIGLGDGTSFTSDWVINAAGLGAVDISNHTGIGTERLYPCKGIYFAYHGRHSCTHLIYPIPRHDLRSLGVHATIDLQGRLRFGPDAEYISATDDYIVDEGKKDSFYSASSLLINGLAYEQFLPDTAGIRPKLQSPDDHGIMDFYIRDEEYRGFPRFINLLGIESPGLTSSLAIGEFVREMVEGRRPAALL